ncbi:MAG: Hsp20/alpha crystallin family protein [Candidatus Heimdallarchaeota archaeon]|nr:Hsp20/alpha crystallin family protein [Candidatus Heimdallarchaeota archaeon]
MADEDKKLIWVHPCVDCGCDCNEIGDDHYHISIELPGVKKKDIDLKIIKTGLRLRANKGKNIEYVSELKFLCDAKTDAVKASYSDGLLSIDVPFDCPDPFKDANGINIS